MHRFQRSFMAGCEFVFLHLETAWCRVKCLVSRWGDEERLFVARSLRNVMPVKPD